MNFAPPDPNDAKLVSYLEMRDRFLVRWSKDDLLETYVAVGRFDVDRWGAEELSRVAGQLLDEAATAARWDECSEKHLRDLRTEAADLVSEKLKTGRVGSLLSSLSETTAPNVARSVRSVVSDNLPADTRPGAAH